MMAVVSSSLNHGFLAGPSLINNMRPPSPKIQSHELQKKEQQEILTFAEALTIDQGTRNVSEPNSMCLRRGESSRESRNPSTQTGDQMPAAVSEIEEEIDQNYTVEEIHQINLEAILNAEPGLEAEKIYVAVGKDLVESAHALTWALENLKIDGGSVILVHVMCTPRFIPTPVGKIPVNQVSRDMVDAFKKDEQKKINKWMKTYLIMCSRAKEIMHDPHVAADGYTYEGEAIKGWLDSGHDTSPMTNLKLSHKNLIPNRSLRSAIIEWIEKTDIL